MTQRLSDRVRAAWSAALGRRSAVVDPAARRSRPGSRSGGAQQLLRLFAGSENGLVTCLRNGTVELCSPVAARLLGASQPDVCGGAISRWLAPLSGSPEGPGVGFEAGQWETLASRADGSTFPVELRVSETRLDGKAQFILILRDITDRRITQERLSFPANFDSLTGLPNRMLFRDRLGQAMSRARRNNTPMALMFLDLDNFKVINDSLGHAVGDQLLCRVAETLTQCLRGTDSVSRTGADDNFTVSRLGGDEFTVVSEQLSGAEDAALIARRILDALEVPIRLLDAVLHVSASIGISMYPADDTDLDGLIRHTDMAMYRAKALGRGTYSFYSADLSAEVAARLTLENQLRRALENNEFVLFYQPKAKLATGKITGVEALLRWQPPGKALVAPDRFISVLEDSGLILPVGAWVLRTACEQLAAWDLAGLPKLTLAVNLSVRQLRQPRLARFVADAINDAGIGPKRLELELTESLLMDDSEAARETLGMFAAMGVRVAMNDFCTGYSSLSYLKRLDIDTLKIDRSFVSALPDDPEDGAIATAIVAMGHSLKMKIVAEGVETAAQADILRKLGCDEMQGYLLTRPLAADAFKALLLAWCAAQPVASPFGTWVDSAPMTVMTLHGIEAER